jgi:hypothetical protein
MHAGMYASKQATTPRPGTIAILRVVLLAVTCTASRSSQCVRACMHTGLRKATGGQVLSVAGCAAQKPKERPGVPK